MEQHLKPVSSSPGWPQGRGGGQPADPGLAWTLAKPGTRPGPTVLLGPGIQPLLAKLPSLNQEDTGLWGAQCIREDVLEEASLSRTWKADQECAGT